MGSVGLPKSCWRNDFTSLHPNNTTAADFIGFGHCSGLLHQQGSILHSSSLPIVAFGLFGYFFLAFSKVSVLLNKMGTYTFALLCRGNAQDGMCCLSGHFQAVLSRKEMAPTLLIWLTPWDPHMVPFFCVFCHHHTVLDALIPSQLWRD